MFSRINVTMALATFFSLAVSTSTAALSQACDNESEALAIDSTISALLDDVFVNANQEFASCTDITCNVDFSDFDANFRSACVAVGGQIFIIHTTQTCINGSDRSTWNQKNQAICVGQSCDKDNVEEFNDQLFDIQDGLNEETFGVGTTCSSDTEIEGSSGGVLSSDPCDNESEALAIDSTLSALLDDVFMNVNQELALCTAIACNVDFSDFDANFRSACVAAGGQIFIIHTTQTCTDGIASSILNQKNQAICAGQSCDKDIVEEFNDQLFDMQDALDEETFGVGTTCTSDTEIEGSSGGVLSSSSSSTATIMGVGTALVVASAVVFL
jgi:hypothetical protein